MTRRWFREVCSTSRAAQAGVFALLTTTLGSAAHAMAGGMHPSAALLAAIGVAIAALTWLVMPASVAPRALATAAAAGQLAVHVVLTVSMPSGSSGLMAWCGRSVPPPGMSLRLRSAAMPGMTVIPESVAAAGMLAAHVAAGAAVGWFCADTLRRGHLMVAFLRRALQPPTLQLSGIAVTCSADGRVRRTTAVVPRSAVRATASRRGPPAGLLAPC